MAFVPVRVFKFAQYDGPRLETPPKEGMYTLTCVKHPVAKYLTKNPYQRSIHVIKFGLHNKECDCPFNDLMVVTDEECDHPADKYGCDYVECENFKERK